MKLQQKRTLHSHRGVIGVESAIVMIAFVIVAAALAFIVLNMGFSTTQKTKQAIVSSTAESSSSMQIGGKVIGSGHVSAGKLNATVFPVKIISGGTSVNLDPSNTAIRYIDDTIEHGNIYAGALTSGVHDTLASAMQAAVTAGYVSSNPVNASTPLETKAIFYFNINRNNNFILDQFEYGMFAIAFEESERPQSLDIIRIEVILPNGSPMTMERTVPNISSSIVDLG